MWRILTDFAFIKTFQRSAFKITARITTVTEINNISGSGSFVRDYWQPIRVQRCWHVTIGSPSEYRVTDTCKIKCLSTRQYKVVNTVYTYLSDTEFSEHCDVCWVSLVSKIQEGNNLGWLACTWNNTWGETAA